MPDYIQYELRPLVEKLRARYPGIRIVNAHYSTNGKGETQQNIRYQAPLAALKSCGLVTRGMLRPDSDSRTWIGDGFNLSRA